MKYNKKTFCKKIFSKKKRICTYFEFFPRTVYSLLYDHYILSYFQIKVQIVERRRDSIAISETTTNTGCPRWIRYISYLIRLEHSILI